MKINLIFITLKNGDLNINLINFISLQAEVMEVIEESRTLQNLQVFNEIAICYKFCYMLVVFTSSQHAEILDLKNVQFCNHKNNEVLHIYI